MSNISNGVPIGYFGVLNDAAQQIKTKAQPLKAVPRMVLDKAGLYEGLETDYYEGKKEVAALKYEAPTVDGTPPTARSKPTPFRTGEMDPRQASLAKLWAQQRRPASAESSHAEAVAHSREPADSPSLGS